MESDIREPLSEILAHYCGQSDDLIPILEETQAKCGYLPKEAMQAIARFLRLAESYVWGVASFYADFRFAPEARQRVKVCTGSACHAQGGKKVLNEVEKQLGIKLGETTGDRQYGLEATPCPGLCAQAPVVEVNETAYGQVTPDRVKEVLDKNK